MCFRFCRGLPLVACNLNCEVFMTGFTMKIRNLYFQVYCVIFCECVLQRQMHIEKRTQSWSTAAESFQMERFACSVCILSAQIRKQHVTRSPHLPSHRYSPSLSPHTSSCLFFLLLVGLASSNQHFCLWAFVDLSFPLLQSINWVKIPQFIYPVYCSWPFGYLILCGCGI